MAKYKLSGDSGVKDTETGACIPFADGNRHYEEYKEWLAEGNTPDPEFTPEEIDARLISQEILELKTDLTRALAWQFRMILALWEVGKSKGLWDNTDITDAQLKAKVVDWKTKLDRLTELGE